MRRKLLNAEPLERSTPHSHRACQLRHLSCHNRLSGELCTFLSQIFAPSGSFTRRCVGVCNLFARLGVSSQSFPATTTSSPRLLHDALAPRQSPPLNPRQLVSYLLPHERSSAVDPQKLDIDSDVSGRGLALDFTLLHARTAPLRTGPRQPP